MRKKHILVGTTIGKLRTSTFKRAVNIERPGFAALKSNNLLVADAPKELTGNQISKRRLEYFSDAVIAIIMTIMVLELKAPHRPDLVSLIPLIPQFFCYLLSFVYLATSWHSHHHLMHAVQQVSGNVLLANTHFLFWLSLIPFTTAWVSENNIESTPVILYGIILFMCALAYYILNHSLGMLHAKDSVINHALGKNLKGKITLIIYAIGIALTFVHPYLGFGVYVGVAAMWAIPDQRFENMRTSRS
jgi:uncharacterized membrane protein